MYFGEYGWLEFDPTSYILAPGEDYRFPELDMKEFTRLVEEVMRNEDSLAAEEVSEHGGISSFRSFAKTINSGLLFIVTFWYIIIPVLYLVFIAFIKLLPLLAVLQGKDQRKKIRNLYLLDLVNLHSTLVLAPGLRGLRRERAESVLEWAERLEKSSGIAFRAWTESFLEAVFAENFPQTRYESALETRRSFLSGFRSLPALSRCAGILVPYRVKRRRT